MDYATLPPLLKPLPYRGFTSLLYPTVQTYREETAVYVASPPVLKKTELRASHETEKIPLLDMPSKNLAEERATMRQDANPQIPDSQQPKRSRRRIGPPRPEANDTLPSNEEVSTRDLDGPTMTKEPSPEVTVTTPTPEEGVRISKIITKEDIARLNQKVNQLYEEVKEKLVATPQHSTQALSWLNEAHTIIMARPDQFLLAELRIHQTELLLKQVDFSQQATKQYAMRLNLWNLAALLILGAFFVFDGAMTSRLLALGWILPPEGFSAPEINSLSWYFQPWLCALAGGIGGTLTAIIILGREIKAREYDPASNTDYYLNGLKGFIFGIVTYFILLGGFISSVASTTIGSEVAHLTQRVQIAGSPPFILFAFLAGFEQQRLLALLARIWGNLTGEPAQSPTAFYDPSFEEAASAPMPVSKEAYHRNQGASPLGEVFDPNNPEGPAVGDYFNQYDPSMSDSFGEGGPPMADSFDQGNFDPPGKYSMGR